MSERKFLSFSQVASEILATVSAGGSSDGGKFIGLGSSPTICLKGKLDLSLWRNFGGEDDDDDDDDEEFDGLDGPDSSRIISPQTPSPILAPLLAAKKPVIISKTSDEVHSVDDGRGFSSSVEKKTTYNGSNDSSNAIGRRGFSPLPGSNHLLLGEQEQNGSNLYLSSSPSVPKRTPSPLLLKNGTSRVGNGKRESGDNAVVVRQRQEEQQPQWNENKAEKLPPIAQQADYSSPSSTTAVLLSSFIGSYQLSSASQFPSGRERVRSATATGKKVEFIGDVLIMESGESAQVIGASAAKPFSANGKNKRSGSGKDEAITRSRTGSAVRRPSSRPQVTDILQEIRKMSLASQDALEDKKKTSTEQESSTGRKFGKKKSQKRRKAEEVFTDKDRAAAVTLGSKDIKQSLKAKKKRDRKMRLSISFVSGEEYVISTLLGEATYQMKVKKKPEAALNTLNKALEIQPTHKPALVARSQCYLKLGDAESALKDAQQAWDPNNPNETYTQGLYQYAEALYQMGEFEKALIAFHRGHRSRKDMDGFRIGIQKCQEAIRRAIGDKTATSIPNLDMVLPLIQELEDTKSRLTPEAKKEVEQDPDDSLLKNIAKYKLGDRIQLSSKTETKVKSKLISRELMGQLCLDKIYLKKFINRPEVINQQGLAKGLRDDACQALKYLEGRERFWRQQNPLYSRKNFSTMLKAHAHELAIRDKPVSEDPSVAKYLTRRRSSTFTEEVSPPPMSLQMRRRSGSSDPHLDKVKGNLANKSEGGSTSKALRKTQSIESSKGKS